MTTDPYIVIVRHGSETVEIVGDHLTRREARELARELRLDGIPAYVWRESDAIRFGVMPGGSFYPHPGS